MIARRHPDSKLSLYITTYLQFARTDCRPLERYHQHCILTRLGPIDFATDADNAPNDTEWASDILLYLTPLL